MTTREYTLKFTADEYWLIYENSYPKDTHLFNHRSTAAYLVLLVLIAIPAVFMYFSDPWQYATPVAALMICGVAVAGILGFKAWQLMKEMRRIGMYYSYIQHGIKVMLNAGSITFYINGRTSIYPVSECVQVIVEDHYMEFRFVSAAPVLIPKGRLTLPDWERLENDLVTLSSELWEES